MPCSAIRQHATSSIHFLYSSESGCTYWGAGLALHESGGGVHLLEGGRGGAWYSVMDLMSTRRMNGGRFAQAKQTRGVCRKADS